MSGWRHRVIRGKTDWDGLRDVLGVPVAVNGQKQDYLVTFSLYFSCAFSFRFHVVLFSHSLKAVPGFYRILWWHKRGVNNQQPDQLYTKAMCCTAA